MKRMKPFILFFMLLFGTAFMSYIPIIIFNIDLSKLPQNLVVLYNFVCDLIFMIIVFFIYRKRIVKEFSSFIKNFGNIFDLSLKYYIVGFIGMVVSNLFISFTFSQANASNEEIVRLLISNYPIYMLFSVSIYAPFIEETIFRRSVKDTVLSFGKKPITKYIYILISGLIFSALHVFGVSNSIYDYLYIIPYLSLGCAFAALYYKTDNLFSSMLWHSIHNTVAILLYIIVGVV